MTQNRFYSSVAAKTTLTASVNASATTLAIAAATGLPVSLPFTLILERDTANEEVVTVTAVSGVTLTVSRAQDGTTGVSHTTGAVVEHGVSARDFNEPQAHIAAAAAVHGITGSVVGTTDAQTLTNKTLNAPTISTITNGGTVTLPTGSVTLVARTSTDTLTNKTIDTASNTLKVNGNTVTATAGTATVTVPNSTDTLVGRATTDTLTNKTLTTPVIAAVKTNGGAATVTLPATTDTLVGRATTDTLTNKTLTGATIDATSTVDGVAASTIAASLDVFTNYTPTWTGSVTNPVIGNGTLSGRYQQIGKLVLVQFKLVIGSTTTLGSGGFSWALPVAASASRVPSFVGCAMRAETGSEFLAGVPIIAASATTFQMETLGNQFVAGTYSRTTSFWGDVIPKAWASGDIIQGTFWYESA